MPAPTLPAPAGAADVSPRPCLHPPPSSPASAPTPYGSTVERMANALELVLERRTERTEHAARSALEAYRREQSEQVQRARVEAARLARIGGLRG